MSSDEDLAEAAARVSVAYLDDLEELCPDNDDEQEDDEEEEEEGREKQNLDVSQAGRQLRLLFGEPGEKEQEESNEEEEEGEEEEAVVVVEAVGEVGEEVGGEEVQESPVVLSSTRALPVPPARRAAPAGAYSAPAGATKTAPASVLIGGRGQPEHRARRMTLAVDLNAYKAQLEQNDLQSKKTQSGFKGIRGLVSKKKKRYIDSKFDLDLAYITDRLIAMGFPSEGKEGIIRNPMSKVLQFFEERHKNHYKVYNLCSERTYKTVAFRAPVAHFGFDDHNPPSLELLDLICADVTEWLDFDERNVAALHCTKRRH